MMHNLQTQIQLVRIIAQYGLSKKIIAIIHQFDNTICIYFLLASFPAFSKIFAEAITIPINTNVTIKPNKFLIYFYPFKIFFIIAHNKTIVNITYFYKKLTFSFSNKFLTYSLPSS